METIGAPPDPSAMTRVARHIFLCSPALVVLRVPLPQETLRRWLRDDAIFQMAYREARRQVVQQAIVQVQQATGEAVATLRQVMQAADAPASAKVSAAKTILETAIKAVELEDLEARIVALEAAQKG